MGYMYQVRGSFEFITPVPWHKIKNTDFMPDSAVRTSVQFEIDEMTRDVPDGILIIRNAIRIVPAELDWYRIRNIIDDINKIFVMFPTHKVIGAMYIRGESWFDISRIDATDMDRSNSTSRTSQVARATPMTVSFGDYRMTEHEQSVIDT